MTASQTRDEREAALYRELHELGVDAWQAKYANDRGMTSDLLDRWATVGWERLKWVGVYSDEINPRTGKPRCTGTQLVCRTFKKYLT